ncbi:MAG: hypothetical protein DMG32_01920 [Acidobacteria bacterium]|nr:MAG: hypothetical protein DMG32_01920 [Acidobacteriota bacterium]
MALDRAADDPLHHSRSPRQSSGHGDLRDHRPRRGTRHRPRTQHLVWRRLPILVTLIGWLTLIRGLLFLFLPPEATLYILAAMQFERLFYIYLAIPFVLGIYLTYLAFTTQTHRSE